MRLRNIPGAKDAILDCEWVIDELRGLKESGMRFLE